MRRIFVSVIAVFIIGAAILISLEYHWEKSISVITILQSYSRLITDPKEELSIPIHVSNPDSFLTDLESIDYASLLSDTNEIEVIISDIRETNQTENLDTSVYTLFYLDLQFAYEFVTDDFLDFIHARLTITYVNGDQLSLEVGDISLMFREIQESAHIDLFRLGAQRTDSDDGDYICGVYIGFQNQSGSDVTIRQVDIGFETILLDLNASVFLNAVPEEGMTVDDILGFAYDPVQGIQETDVLLVQNCLLFLPLDYQEGIERIHRFPIIITYEYQEEEYQYLIDDFIFFQSDCSLGGNNGFLRETLYHRQ